MLKPKYFNILLILAFTLLIGCSGGDDLVDNGDSGSGTGILAINLRDKPATDLQAVYVTIDEVRICSEAAGEDIGEEANNEEEACAWEVMATQGGTYNLLELVNGVMANLSETELEAGVYHQIRLMIGETPESATNIMGNDHPYANYVIVGTDESETEWEAHALKIPSGVQSGIKLVHEFEVPIGGEIELILDFDAERSIVKAGGKKNTKHLLKPVIKILDTINMDLVEVSGEVSDSASQEPIGGALVSAQQHNEATEELTTPASTFTSDDESDKGRYQLLLDRDEVYILVAAAGGYQPQCRYIDAVDMAGDVDFSLEPAETRTVEGVITGVDENGEELPEVTISFREKDQTCGDINGDYDIEILQLTIGYDDDDPNEDDDFVGYRYSADLPLGEYWVVFTAGDQAGDQVLQVEAGEDSLEANLSFSE